MSPSPPFGRLYRWTVPAGLASLVGGTVNLIFFGWLTHRWYSGAVGVIAWGAGMYALLNAITLRRVPAPPPFVQATVYREENGFRATLSVLDSQPEPLIRAGLRAIELAVSATRSELDAHVAEQAMTRARAAKGDA